MAGKKNPDTRRTITARIDGALVDRARVFVRNEAGKPLFLTMNKLIEQSLAREIDRLELVLSGALPADRSTGRDIDAGQTGSRRKPINAAT